MKMQLKYYVPFKSDAADAQLAIKERLLNIEGVAIDTSVNSNKWQVPEQDLDFFVSSLIGSQLRIDHTESALAVIGRVPEAKRVGASVWFRAEVGELSIIEKITRGYLTHVSVQVDSDEVECSKCGKQTRKEGMLIHLCPAAWEIVHKPKVRELSIVASPAYRNTEFHPLGFAAAMNDSLSRYRQVDSVMDRARDLIQKLKELKESDNDVTMDSLVIRLGKLVDDLRSLPQEERKASLECLRARLMNVQRILAALPRERQRSFLDELLTASKQEPEAFTGMLDKICEVSSFIDTGAGTYFEDAEALEKLRKLMFQAALWLP